MNQIIVTNNIKIFLKIHFIKYKAPGLNLIRMQVELVD